MENKPQILTRYVFTCLYQKVLNTFYQKGPGRKHLRAFQVFGFGNFDHSKPSLKQELQTIAGFHINGKYLYNKIRESEKDFSSIRLNKEYRFLLFNYIGYKDLKDFLDRHDIPDDEVEKQVSLLKADKLIKDAYYISYYYGEDGKIIKGQAKVYNNWKNIEFRFCYKINEEHTDVYIHHGVIIERNGLMHIPLKLQLEDKQNESGYISFFVGKALPEARKFMLGTYAGFDRDDSPVCGRLLMEKEESRADMMRSFEQDKIDPIILNVINDQRIQGLNFIPNDKMQFDKNSPFQSQIIKYYGKHTLLFLDNEGLLIDFLPIKIDHCQSKLVSLSNNLIKTKKIYLSNKAQVLILRFEINGTFNYVSVSIQINTNEVSDAYIMGHFLAINKKNMSEYGQVIMFKKLILAKEEINKEVRSQLKDAKILF